MRILIGALALSLAGFAGAASAEEVAPAAAKLIDLGEVRGVAYYTVSPAGYRIVATVVSSNAGPPVRITATLAPDQRFDLSVPGAVGEADAALAFVRHGDRLEVVRDEIAAN